MKEREKLTGIERQQMELSSLYRSADAIIIGKLCFNQIDLENISQIPGNFLCGPFWRSGRIHTITNANFPYLVNLEVTRLWYPLKIKETGMVVFELKSKELYFLRTFLKFKFLQFLSVYFPNAKVDKATNIWQGNSSV